MSKKLIEDKNLLLHWVFYLIKSREAKYRRPTGDIPMVAVKFLPLDFVFDLLWWLEQNLVTEGEIPNFTVGGPIVVEYPG